MVYVINEAYITELFGFGKKKASKKAGKKYTHLTEQEIKKIISIAKQAIGKYPKLKKSTNFVDVTKKDEFDDDKSPLEAYYGKSGNSEIIVARGDPWDGYPTLRTNYEEFENDECAFSDDVNEKLKSSGIKAHFTFSGDGDWDDIEFVVSSRKEE